MAHLLAAAASRGRRLVSGAPKERALVLDIGSSGVLVTTQTAPEFDSVPGSQSYVSAQDVSTKEIIVFADWRPLINVSVPGLDISPGQPGPEDVFVDQVGAQIPTTGCLPGADFYTVVTVLPNADGAKAVRWQLRTASGGVIASSFPAAWWANVTGTLGSGYNPRPHVAYYVERWCAPTPAALQGGVTATLSVRGSARAYTGASASAQPVGAAIQARSLPPHAHFTPRLSVSLSPLARPSHASHHTQVLSPTRCLLAPDWDTSFWEFPAPGTSATFSLPGGFSRGQDPLCAGDANRLLETSSLGTPWSWNVLQARATPVRRRHTLAAHTRDAPVV